MARSARTLRVEAEDALIRNRVFAVMKARDWELLHAIARYAEQDVNPRIARSDPSRYRLLRAGVTGFHLKGLTHLTPERICHVTGYVPDSSIFPYK